jgi:hypothetical protein
MLDNMGNMKNSRKGFIVPLVIVIIALLAIGGGAYVYTHNKSADTTSVSTETSNQTMTTVQNNSNITSTPGQTAVKTNTTSSSSNTVSDKATNSSLKTYTNSQFGFSVKYPQTVSLKTNGKFDGDQSANLANTNSDTNRVNFIALFTLPQSQYKGVDTANIFLTVNSSKCITSDATKIMKNGMTFWTTDLTNAGVGHFYDGGIYSTEKNNICYSIGWYEDGLSPYAYYGEDQQVEAVKAVKLLQEYTANHKSIFQQMLSSFEFAATSNLTSAQIYQEVSSQLGLPSKLEYFRIWGQDRVQYNFGPGTNFAYKLDGKWHLVGKGNSQSGELCSDLSSVPAQYNPGCYNETTKQSKYITTNPDGTGTSVNYPPSQMISYIGQ